MAGLRGGNPPRQDPKGHVSHSSLSSASFSMLSDQVSPLIQRPKTGPRKEMLVGKHRRRDGNLQQGSIPDSGHKYYLQFTTEDYKSGENAGSCLATVLYPKTKSPPVVSIKCTHTKDQKQIQEEDNRLYQKIRHQTKPIIGNNIPDSYGNIEPALEPAWALAVAGSSYIMWEKSTENLGYFMAQVTSVKQWIRKDDFIEFDYTVLLHEIPTQEIISCHMRLTWLPGHPLKVKYFCASENQGLEDGSGMESGSAAGILHERGANF
ncbi:PREDICTED: retinoic acid receptor responder protein 1 [Fulmarus glacialis]|nr:PREDICTED: retinoic acid receptor responder protein 1 [Fulmarus glacialis]